MTKKKHSVRAFENLCFVCQKYLTTHLSGNYFCTDRECPRVGILCVEIRPLTRKKKKP